jgi:hypothetical protein
VTKAKKMKNKVAYYIDKNIPRSTDDQPEIHIKPSMYLARLSNLRAKFDSVTYRKEQWEKSITEFKENYEKHCLTPKLNKEMNLPEGAIATINHEYKDTRIENEFEMLAYSFGCALTSLTSVITSFLSGKHQVHSHTKLLKILKDKGYGNLLEIVECNTNDWTAELKIRRDTATHHSTLSLKSNNEHVFKDNKIISTSELFLGIPKFPNKLKSLWEYDIPLADGTNYKSKTIGGNEEIKIYDNKGQLVFEDILIPVNNEDLIEGREYIDTIYLKLEIYIVDVLKELNNKLISKT